MQCAVTSMPRGGLENFNRSSSSVLQLGFLVAYVSSKATLETSLWGIHISFVKGKSSKFHLHGKGSLTLYSYEGADKYFVHSRRWRSRIMTGFQVFKISQGYQSQSHEGIKVKDVEKRDNLHCFSKSHE